MSQEGRTRESHEIAKVETMGIKILKNAEINEVAVAKEIAGDPKSSVL